MTNQSNQQAQLSWLQSSSGEWLYFLDENLASEDLSSVVEQDYIWLVSQETSAHKISGYRIANETIEAFIKQLAGVEQVVVFGVPHEQKGNAIHIYIELSSKAIELATLSNAINAKLAGCLGEFARAEVIKYVEQLPMAKNKTITRKILKSQNITMNYAA
ncbi:AMP-binding enzyme [Cognaticolwellia aestuarii]|uniref:AMP-binding enzyme n=1 Tax=Cognaticolwellia aestuarii TaxID=329993 RepID=UPI000987C074|nr:acyl-CoA synthetase [Cognaticolwellia aestuarii]